MPNDPPRRRVPFASHIQDAWILGTFDRLIRNQQVKLLGVAGLTARGRPIALLDEIMRSCRLDENQKEMKPAS
jgi:hypothetical protein